MERGSVDKIDQSSPAKSNPNPRDLTLLLMTIATTLFILILSGVPDLSHNESRIGGYVWDALHRGNWIIQRDSTGEIASKPCLLYTSDAADDREV